MKMGWFRVVRFTPFRVVKYASVTGVSKSGKTMKTGGCHVRNPVFCVCILTGLNTVGRDDNHYYD